MTADTQAGSPAAQTGPEQSTRRWLVLGAGVFAQAATCMLQFGVPYLLHSATPLVPHTSGAVPWGLRARRRQSERRNQ
jgi:hypothetical protein